MKFFCKHNWLLADSGLRTVEYESGYKLSVDSAVRMCVMTGVNQLNQKYREQSMDCLETDLVEVTAHLGARNTDGPNGWENHAAWQGKVYRWRKGGGGYTKTERQTTPSTPIQTAIPASAQLASAPRTVLTPVDVTQGYLDAATQGQGSITYEDGYTAKNHQAEINMAEWLHKIFGGEIKLLREAEQDSYYTGFKSFEILLRLPSRFSLFKMLSSAGQKAYWSISSTVIQRMSLCSSI